MKQKKHIGYRKRKQREEEERENEEKSNEKI